MELLKAFTFVSRDSYWGTKLSMGVLLAVTSFLILPLFILVGYSVHVTENVKNNVEYPLPDWNLKKNLADGFIICVALLIYSLLILLLIRVGLILIGGLQTVTNVETSTGTSLNTLLFFGCITLLYSFLLTLITPAIYIQYIRHGNLSATLNYRNILRITFSQLGNILLSIITLFFVGIVISSIAIAYNVIPCAGQIACFFIILTMIPYFQMTSGHLWGQIARCVDDKTHY